MHTPAPRLPVAACIAALFLAAPRGLPAQQAAPPNETTAAIAVADSLLHALSTGDNATLARLTLDSALVGGIGVRNGAERLSLRSFRADIQRPFTSVITERGFGAAARANAWIATVWMPYDLYRDGQWSHCGVDTFTLMKVNGAWRVASLLYTIEQPPACAKHPDGPPAATAPAPLSR